MANVALVGTTASGKSALAPEAARVHGGVEILCVDSMTVYRGMDIGTAKPGPAVRAEIPHHLLDLADPAEEFTVSEFQAAASGALASVSARGHRALLVGGTGLYLRAVVDALDIPGRFPDVAAELERQAEGPDGTRALHRRLAALDPLAASRTTDTNRRRIVRALEVTIGSGRPFSSYGPGLTTYRPTPFVLIGLPYAPQEVDRRIEERFRRWLDEGLLEEVRALAARSRGLSRTARQALGYRELLEHVERGVPLEDCVVEAVRRTRTFARRQWSWLRRDPRIRWVGAGEDPLGVVLGALGAGCPAGDAPCGSPARGSVARGARLSGVVRASEPTVEHGQGPKRAVSKAAERGTEGRRTRRRRAAVAGPLLRMSKHEAAGNDFLVALDPGEGVLTPERVRALCDRRRGVGADGIVVGVSSAPGAPGPQLAMELHNADGTVAEMSGNGIRCLVQAAVDAGLVDPGTVAVSTAAGVRTVEYQPRGPGGQAVAGVEMGTVGLGRRCESPVPGGWARLADVGNPHLVVVGEFDPWALDLDAIGRRVERTLGEPVNVEVVRAGPVPGSLELRVWERGVGETRACGTGSCAAAAVARSAGTVGDRVSVVNPGGTLEVHLGPRDDDPVVLVGPVRRVADVLVDLRTLEPPGGDVPKGRSS